MKQSKGRILPRLTRQQFELRQPEGDIDSTTLSFYLDLANRLVAEAEKRDLLMDWAPAVVSRAAMLLACHLQDVVADGGVWRSFSDECERLYGRRVPFFPVSEDYVLYELNREDIRFLTWYSLSMSYDDLRLASPTDSRIMTAADVWFEMLDEVYDDAPECQNWTQSRFLELNDPDDVRQVYHYANWLFMYCYLLTPAYALTLEQIMAGIDMKKAEPTEIEAKLEKSMQEDPTGPLALYLSEWLSLVIEGKLPKTPAPEGASAEAAEHPYWAKFTAATSGERIKFIGSYAELNEFFINVIGWAPGKEYFPEMKNEHDFVLLVDQHKGMLMARNVARCIALPQNPFYDKEYASVHAIDLLTRRGLCPADLLHYIKDHNALPDAAFPANPADPYAPASSTPEREEAKKLVSDNFDFIARCYLQLYYRGD